MKYIFRTLTYIITKKPSLLFKDLWEQAEKIYRCYLDCGSYRAVGRAFRSNHTMIKKVIDHYLSERSVINGVQTQTL